MTVSRSVLALAAGLTVAFATPAGAGAPQPDQRQGDFAQVCQSGPNRGQPCTIATQDTDCPRSACVLQAVSKSVKGTLTIIAHDSVTDWLNGGATNRALTVMLEVKDPDGVPQILAASYQDLTDPTSPPAAPGNVVAIGMDEAALKTLAGALNGLLFVQPEATLRTRLQELFGTTATPVLVAVQDRRLQSADHTGDGLATVLRFPVRIQFVDPA